VFDIVQSVSPEPQSGLDSILAVCAEAVLGRTSPKIMEGRTNCSLMPRRKKNLMLNSYVRMAFLLKTKPMREGRDMKRQVTERKEGG